jgi:hypothetical protein
MENVMGIIKNESAQFMLLAGFIIAIGLVITTVMLNNIIFESNMAGEAGGDPIKYDVVNLMRISGDEMKSAYRNATNVSGVSKDNMIANFTNQTQNFSANLPKIYALHGEGVNVSWDVSNWNNGFYANFTNNGTVNGENLTLIENVKNVTIFELINVSGSNLNVTVTNQNTDAVLWSMKLDGNGVIKVNSSYSFNINYSYINLLNSSYNFNKSIGSNNYKISFIDGQKDNGKFKMTGNTTYGINFIQARDYILNTTITLSTSNMRANITIPVSVPW